MFLKKRITLGEGYLDRITLFENKYLFSIHIHIFNTIKQDRFYTHAFAGIAFLLKGGYEEEWKDENGLVHIKQIKPGIRFIPRYYNHRIMKSKKNTISVLFTGPWDKLWTEEKDGKIRVLTWGRKVIL